MTLNNTYFLTGDYGDSPISATALLRNGSMDGSDKVSEFQAIKQLTDEVNFLLRKVISKGLSTAIVKPPESGMTQYQLTGSVLLNNSDTIGSVENLTKLMNYLDLSKEEFDKLITDLFLKDKLYFKLGSGVISKNKKLVYGDEQVNGVTTTVVLSNPREIKDGASFDANFNILSAPADFNGKE